MSLGDEIHYIKTLFFFLLGGKGAWVSTSAPAHAVRV